MDTLQLHSPHLRSLPHSRLGARWLTTRNDEICSSTFHEVFKEFDACVEGLAVLYVGQQNEGTQPSAGCCSC
ncbi:hypothetical protein D9Q98_005924 [Chlorella vulgaris]|uniref:Uncharacterized protein n=1 Tax=Chlorella vulgaris TaxID=3077 RepID=A0A9D4TXR3_CHLVU|nr:hypothetical protein D9Q98_005924 [Chlorella vulgaris]